MSIKTGEGQDRNFTRTSLAKFIKSADAALDDYLKRLDQGDATEGSTPGSRVANLGAKIAALRQRRDPCARRHRPTVGIGQRNLVFAALLQRGLHLRVMAASAFVAFHPRQPR